MRAEHHGIKSVIAAGVAVSLLAAACAAQSVSIEKPDGRFHVIGWQAPTEEPPKGWASLFSLYAGEGDVPPLLGTYAVEDGVLIFHPRYPPTPGVLLHAVFRPPGGTTIEARFLEEARRADPSTFVEQVYPTADVLPDNQLKFYIQFSAPMSRGEAWKRIHLLDASGSAVDHAFLEIDQELWDHGMQRLTVLFDPGRIKRGVLPREELGPALIEGEQYILRIDRDWQDAGGAPLVRGFRKTFRVGPSDRVSPEVNQWKVSSPAPGSSDPLTVRFAAPMDWALLHRLLQVRGPDGPVAGRVLVEDNERQWQIHPELPWQPGAYELIVQKTLEDLAGNKIGRAFDVDLDRFDEVTTQVSTPTVSIPFRVGGE